MNKIENIFEVFENGSTLPYGLKYEERESQKNQLGAKYTVATRWTYLGETYDDPNCPVPIPDGSGLVYATKGWKSWIVLEPNGRKNFEIKVPKLSQSSKPNEGELGAPQYRPDMPSHVMYGEGGDGDRYDVRFYFDMRSGNLVRTEFVGRHW